MKTIIDAIVRSWVTTLLGFLTMIAIAWPQVQFMLDNDPATEPEWNIVMAAVLTFLGFSQVRDNRLTSKQAGVE